MHSWKVQVCLSMLIKLTYKDCRKLVNLIPQCFFYVMKRPSSLKSRSSKLTRVIGGSISSASQTKGLPRLRAEKDFFNSLKSKSLFWVFFYTIFNFKFWIICLIFNLCRSFWSICLLICTCWVSKLSISSTFLCPLFVQKKKFWQLFLVTFFLWRKICTKKTLA